MAVTSTAKARRTREERKSEFRSHLQSTMERLLVKERFPEITIDQIVAEAKISRSTLYSYFPDKASLLLALASDIVDTAAQAARPWWSQPYQASRNDVERVLGTILDLYLTHQRVFSAFVEAAGYEPSIRERFGEMQNASRTALERHIIEGQASGVVRPELLPHETAGWIIWMIERGFYQMLVPATPSEVSRLLRALADIIFLALYVTDNRG